QQPGDAHDLTFSCYERLPLLTSDHAKAVFLSSLDKARKKYDFDIWAYVIMPEHVHLLIHFRKPIYSIEEVRKSIRQRTAKTLLTLIRAQSPALAGKLGVLTDKYRFWQKGKGFDRNLFSTKAIHAAINYLHANPVRRGLCENDLDYPWSSARFYAEVGEVLFSVNRCPVVKMRRFGD
ncbi:MAG: transposase, partial [Fimbriimonadales bacterium]